MGNRDMCSAARLASSTRILLIAFSRRTQYISYMLNMYSDIGPSPSSHTWGCALLSKFPIVNSTHLLLPSPAGELAPAIHATLDIYGEMVDVVVAHNGQEEDARDRELQSIELARVMREAWPRPVIFLGSFGFLLPSTRGYCSKLRDPQGTLSPNLATSGRHRTRS